MDYLITFEDGSDAYLSHYGVKGMKWKHRKGTQSQGGGGSDESDPEDFNAEDFGMVDNSPESRQAVYDERGLNPNMTREQAMAKVKADWKKWDAESGPAKTNKAMMNRRIARLADMKVVKSLPTNKQKAAKQGRQSVLKVFSH